MLGQNANIYKKYRYIFKTGQDIADTNNIVFLIGKEINFFLITRYLNVIEL